MEPNGIGIDIGGANLKAAKPTGEARMTPFELWKKPDQLAEALRDLLVGWDVTHLAVTMTGELCDCYESKRDGVSRILAEVTRAFPASKIRVWSTSGIFLTCEDAEADPLRVAAANWHALATFAGRFAGEASALLLDTGSTTTDIIPIEAGNPVAQGATDPERLLSRELVYTGVRRTPICALLQEGVCAELFATTQDAYLWLGHLPESIDDRQTADGRPATLKYAQARLARMLGGDPEITPTADTDRLALLAFEAQRKKLVQAIRTVTARLSKPLRTVILFGSGEFLARAAWLDYAAELDRDHTPTVEIVSLAERLGPATSTAACAYAVAVLFEEHS